MTRVTEQIADSPSFSVGREDRLDGAARALPRRRFFSDMPDKGLFAAFALTGFLAVILLKSYSLLSSEVLAGAAVGAMLFYGFLSFQLPAIQMRPDRLGDNFYYLGFIYTLASLSAALLQLRSSPDVASLLGNFGIALITTVVGVSGRVLFVQMRGDIDDVEERVRRDLAAASNDLRAQLVLALTEFETFHTGILQASREATLKAGDQIREAASKAAEQVEVQISQIGKVTENAVGRVKSSADNTDARAERLSDILQKLTTAISEIPAMSKIEMPNERLEKQLVSFSGELELLIKELRGAASRVRRRSQVRRKWYWPFPPKS